MTMTEEGELTDSGDTAGLAAFLGEREAGEAQSREVYQGALPVQQHA